MFVSSDEFFKIPRKPLISRDNKSQPATDVEINLAEKSINEILINRKRAAKELHNYRKSV